MARTKSDTTTDARSLSTEPTPEYYKNFFELDINYNPEEVDATIGYFLKRGFDKVAAINTASVLLQQAKIDGVKVFELIDTLQGMDKVQLSYIVTEILNHNRSNTSSLGYKVKTENSLSEKRNIVV